ncbi:MAG TPA: hypothetical protein VFV08_00125, partial [Puia sp.]|nr:hypothetical protein [Puia sp.]
MKKLLPFIVVLVLMIVGCSKTNKPVSSNNPPPPPPPPVKTEVDSAILTNDYDATFSNDTIPFNWFAYHCRQILYYFKGKPYEWEMYLYNAHDTFYQSYGVLDTAVAQKKGCFALISNIDPSQQANYNYYIGNYYKFSLFNDTAVGNVQFMIPSGGFPAIDSMKLDSMYYCAGGLNSFYAGMTVAEVKILPDFRDFVKSGDNFSYANSQIPAIGSIDSANGYVYATRFSDNGIHPSPGITKTMDANYALTLYFHNGHFTLINGKFTNLFFQKKPL